MMKPRSAPVTSIAESSTSASTSSSTRPDPSAAQPFEQRRHLPQLRRGRDGALFHRRRLVVDEEDDLGVAGIPEPDLVAVRQHFSLVICSPLTNVPKRDCLSRMTQRRSRRVISACTREMSAPGSRRSVSLRRPMVNSGLSS